MVQNGLVSVIVAVYNTEKYLERCVESIRKQTYHNLEIILVNDGSKDSSLDICRRFQKEDPRIVVIDQENAGAGLARSAGVKVATGEYLTFVDSDDYPCEDMVEKAYTLAKTESYDAVCFGIYNVDLQGQIWQTVKPHMGKCRFEGREIVDELLPNMISPDPNTGELHFPFLAVYTGLYSNALIQKENWEFVSERKIAFEDCYSLMKLYNCMSKVGVLEEALYYYCENKNSLSSTIRTGRCEYLGSSHKACIELCHSLGFSEIVENRLSQVYIDNLIANLKQIEFAELSLKEKYASFSNVIKDDYVTAVIRQLVMGSMSIKKKFLISCMGYRFVLLVWLMMALNRKR